MKGQGEKKNTIGSIILCIFVVTICIGFGYEFYKHEKNQQIAIADLKSKVSKLDGEMTQLKNIIEGKSIEWGKSGVNYLAIGNSITAHGLATYWWDKDRGMAATTDEKDYVNLIGKYLGGYLVVLLYINLDFRLGKLTARTEPNFWNY